MAVFSRHSVYQRGIDSAGINTHVASYPAVQPLVSAHVKADRKPIAISSVRLFTGEAALERPLRVLFELWMVWVRQKAGVNPCTAVHTIQTLIVCSDVQCDVH